MKFGIFYEHQLPRPWGEHSELELFQEAPPEWNRPGLGQRVGPVLGEKTSGLGAGEAADGGGLGGFHRPGPVYPPGDGMG